jgi:hypothetical protein
MSPRQAKGERARPQPWVDDSPYPFHR